MAEAVAEAEAEAHPSPSDEAAAVMTEAVAEAEAEAVELGLRWPASSTTAWSPAVGDYTSRTASTIKVEQPPQSKSIYKPSISHN